MSSGPEALARLRSAERVGYLFPGGSARCAFQVGVIEELTALGVRPAMLVGVSGGAWNAAAVAAGQAHRTDWSALVRAIGIGRLRTREVLLGERHPATEARGEIHPAGYLLSRLVDLYAAPLRRR